MDPKLIGQVVCELLLLSRSQFNICRIHLRYLSDSLCCSCLFLGCLVWATVATTVFTVFADVMVIVVNANTHERLPSGEYSSEHLRLIPLLHDRETNLVSSVFAFAVDCSSRFAHVLEAARFNLVWNLVAYPNEDVWLEIEHENSVWLEVGLTEVIQLLQSHVLGVGSVVLYAKHFFFVWLFRSRIALLVLLLVILCIH